MKKILFCYFHPQDNQNYTPVDIGYIAALVKINFPHKFDIKIVPVSFLSGQKSPDFYVGQDIADITSFQPNAVFFFLDNVLWFNVFALERAKILVTELKNRKPEIFIGLQSHKIQSKEIMKILNSGLVDCIVKKNLENSFRELDKILKKEKVAGIAYFDGKNKKIINCEENDLKTNCNLDYLPSPYLEGIFDDFLKEKQLEFNGNFRAYLYFSRGCSFACYYCFRSVKYNKDIYFFSVARFYDEIEYLLDRFDIKDFFILDDSFLNPRLKMDNFLEEFERRKKKNPALEKITLSVMIRPELLNSRSVLFLSKINVRWMQIGLQTVNPNLQKYINRNFAMDNFGRIAEMLHKNGIKLHLDVIIGLPDDTLKYFKKTVDYALELKPYSIQVKQFYLNPETLFYEQRKKYGIKTHDRRSGYYVPYVREARGGIGEKHFREASRYVEDKIEEFPAIKWKLVTFDTYYISEGWWSFL